MSETLRHTVKIMIIRHAEKPPRRPPPYGVTLEGEREQEDRSNKKIQGK